MIEMIDKDIKTVYDYIPYFHQSRGKTENVK